MNKTTFSIITPCFNGMPFIVEAIESVLAQNFSGVEHIIVDGGSTDGTLAALAQYPHLRIISEPDNGMYDAINKGIKLATGNWIGLLNADDIYPPGAFAQAADALQKDTDILAVNGGFAVFEDRGNERKMIRESPSIADGEFWERIVRGSTAPNTWFIHRSVFDQLGLYDDRYRTAADRELIMRLALGGVRPLSLPGNNYYFRQHEGSATFSTQDSRNPARGEFRIRTILESLDIQENYLAKKHIPKEMRKELLHGHTTSTYKLAATALFHRKWKQFLTGAWRGWRYNFFWPLIFLVLLAKRIQKEIGFNA